MYLGGPVYPSVPEIGPFFSLGLAQKNQDFRWFLYGFKLTGRAIYLCRFPRSRDL